MNSKTFKNIILAGIFSWIALFYGMHTVKILLRSILILAAVPPLVNFWASALLCVLFFVVLSISISSWISKLHNHNNADEIARKLLNRMVLLSILFVVVQFFAPFALEVITSNKTAYEANDTLYWDKINTPFLQMSELFILDILPLFIIYFMFRGKQES